MRHIHCRHQQPPYWRFRRLETKSEVTDIGAAAGIHHHVIAMKTRHFTQIGMHTHAAVHRPPQHLSLDHGNHQHRPMRHPTQPRGSVIDFHLPPQISRQGRRTSPHAHENHCIFVLVGCAMVQYRERWLMDAQHLCDERHLAQSVVSNQLRAHRKVATTIKPFVRRSPNAEQTQSTRRNDFCHRRHHAVLIRCGGCCGRPSAAATARRRPSPNAIAFHSGSESDDAKESLRFYVQETLPPQADICCPNQSEHAATSPTETPTLSKAGGSGGSGFAPPGFLPLAFLYPNSVPPTPCRWARA